MISVCLIARNEAEIIERAIASTAGLADEVILVDTGSTDNTNELATLAGAIVYGKRGDSRNLGGSRNMAIDAASGDWIVILDADERIADPAGLRAFLEGTTAQAVYIRETYVNGDRYGLAFSQMRCWRAGTYRYRYRCHEVPIPTNGWGEIAYTDFVFEHRPPPRPSKADYYLMVLLMDVEEHPGDPRPVYYLSRQWMYCRAWDKCIETTGKFLEMAAKDHPDRGASYHNMALCYEAMGNMDNALDNLWRAVQAEPTARSRWGILAETLHSKGQHEVAAGMLRLALTLPAVERYSDPRWSGAHVYDLLARCLWYAGRKDEGREHAWHAAQLEPDNERLQDNLRWFEEPGHASVNSDD